jgi:hypothetical protein
MEEEAVDLSSDRLLMMKSMIMDIVCIMTNGLQIRSHWFVVLHTLLVWWS